MMTNPYQPPSASNDDDEPRERASEEIEYESPAEVVAPLRETRPWVKLVSTACFVFAALSSVFGFYVLFIDDLHFPTWMGLVYLVIAAVYVYPATYLRRYAAAIQAHLRTRDADSLATALRHQRAFWKYAGAMTLLVVAGYVVAIALIAFGALTKHALPHK